jgi:hypothetical protein
MPDREPPGASPQDSGVVAPEPPDAREDADARERTERSSQNALSEKEVAELEARMREHRRPYEPPTRK